MGQRFILDRPSFEQFLAAASFLQQIQRQAARNGIRDFRFAQPLLELVETQHAIESGRLSLETAIARIVGLSMKVVGASGAAAWLFTQNEFVFCAGTGNMSREDDRLRLQVLGRLAGGCELHGAAPLAFSHASQGNQDDGHYPGSIKSLLVVPIYQGRDIAGALAASSPELDAFQDRDSTNLRLLAGLIAHALSKTAAAGLKQSMALERVAMLKVIHRIMPALQQLVDEQVAARETAPDSFVSLRNPAATASTTGNEEKSSEDELADSGPTIPEEILSASQRAWHELPLQPVQSSSADPEPPVDDISLPFVGVRSALGGDLVEESRFWESLLAGLAAPGRGVYAGIASFFRGLAWELDGLREAASRAGLRIRHAFSYRPTFPSVALPRLSLPKLPQLHLRERGLRMRSFLGQTSLRLRGHAQALSGFIPRLPDRPAFYAHSARLRHRTLAVRIALLTGIQLLQVRVRAALRRVPPVPSMTITFPAFPAQVVRQSISRLRSGSLRIAEQSRAELAFIVRHRPESRSLRRAAPAGVILLVMGAFLMSQAGLYHPSQTAVASSRNVNTASLLPQAQPSSLASSAAHVETSPTHRQITDPDVMEEIQELSRYEVAGIRRLAFSGDEYSEFELGMLYETGHGLAQNCAKAAEWVTKAAEQGNPAAAYNLGLRYRDGDGVSVNPAEADKWLHKAALHKYPHPKLALASVSGAR